IRNSCEVDGDSIRSDIVGRIFARDLFCARGIRYQKIDRTMKNLIIIFFTVLAIPAVAQTANPFVRNIYTADPSTHVWSDGRLYVYPSHDIDPPQGCDLMDKYHVFSTDDMINWLDHGEILGAAD